MKAVAAPGRAPPLVRSPAAIAPPPPVEARPIEARAVVPVVARAPVVPVRRPMTAKRSAYPANIVDLRTRGCGNRSIETCDWHGRRSGCAESGGHQNGGCGKSGL